MPSIYWNKDAVRGYCHTLPAAGFYACIAHRLQSLFIFLFGLLHAMGFAGALLENGISPNALIPSLDLQPGVEMAQLSVILAAYLLVARWCRQKPWYNRFVLYPFSVLASIISIWCTINRIIQ